MNRPPPPSTRTAAAVTAVTAPTRGRRSGFTLNELLIVIAIAVLILALAVPAFNVITNSRSIDSAENQVSAFLATARAEAIGLQQPRGVIFFVDPVLEQVAMAQVQFPPDRDRPFIDLFGGRDELLLPRGVGLKIVPNGEVTGAAGSPGQLPPFNQWPNFGVVMFDGDGRLMQEPVQIVLNTALANRLGATKVWDKKGSPPREPQTNIGFVLFDAVAFAEQPGAAEQNRWMQENGVPYLVNRYTGTLLRGE